MPTRPTDQDICGAVRKWGNRSTTAVVASVLQQAHGADLKTAWVRARLFYLEARGNVVRVDSSYQVQHCWSCTDPGPAEAK